MVALAGASGYQIREPTTVSGFREVSEMTRIVLDDYLREKLRNLAEPLELCDETGRVLAHVVPVSATQEPAYEPSEPPVSEDELHR